MRPFTEEEYSSGRIFLQFQNLKTTPVGKSLSIPQKNKQYKKPLSEGNEPKSDSTESQEQELKSIPDGSILLNKDHPKKDAKYVLPQKKNKIK